MDDARRLALESELAEAIQERSRLDIVIAYLMEKLGREPLAMASADSLVPPASTGGSGRVSSVDASRLVAEGEFHGMTQTAAAAAVLAKVGRPHALKTEELVRAIRKGGVQAKNAGILYRSLVRHSKFKRVGKGLWGLAAWYPGGAAKPSKPGQPHRQDASENEEPPDEESA